MKGVAKNLYSASVTRNNALSLSTQLAVHSLSRKIQPYRVFQFSLSERSFLWCIAFSRALTFLTVSVFQWYWYNLEQTHGQWHNYGDEGSHVY